MKALDQQDQAASAAADLENAVTWLNGRLFDQYPPGRIAAE